MNIDGYKPDMNDLDYVGNLLKAFEFRIDFLKKETQSSNNINRLPDEAIQSLQNVAAELRKSLLRNVVA